jgi:hypothetical protein
VHLPVPPTPPVRLPPPVRSAANRLLLPLILPPRSSCGYLRRRHYAQDATHQVCRLGRLQLQLLVLLLLGLLFLAAAHGPLQGEKLRRRRKKKSTCLTNVKVERPVGFRDFRTWNEKPSYASSKPGEDAAEDIKKFFFVVQSPPIPRPITSVRSSSRQCQLLRNPDCLLSELRS